MSDPPNDVSRLLSYEGRGTTTGHKKKKTDITTRVTLWAASLKSDIFSTIPGIPGNSPMLGQQNRTKLTHGISHGISQGIYIGVMILHGM